MRAYLAPLSVSFEKAIGFIFVYLQNFGKVITHANFDHSGRKG
jgi:hypothetical protein